MAHLNAQERLALTLDELDDVERAFAPGAERLAPEEREDLVSRLRAHLDRIEHDAAGVSFSSPDRLPTKIATLERALSLFAGEDERPEQARIAQRAMEMKKAAQPALHPDPGDYADPGPVPHPNEDAATATLTAEAHRTVVERSRKAR